MTRASLLAFCLFLADCTAPAASSQTQLTDNADDAINLTAMNQAVAAEDPHPFSDPASPSWGDIDDALVMHRYFWSSHRPKSNCSPAKFYPGGRVPISFYNWPYPPEQKKFEDCLGDETAALGASFLRLALPGDFPKTGTCYTTRIKELYDGQGALYDNGIRQFDWKASRQLVRSRVGDPVRVCVSWIPENCPAHDLRGIWYKTTNLRTRDRWELGADQHSCWGA